VRGALLMRRTPTLAGNLALFLRRHRGEAPSLFSEWCLHQCPPFVCPGRTTNDVPGDRHG
jgi:hypothetical protein